MKLKNNFLKAGSLYLIGNVFDKAVAFITVPIFTRILSTADYGIVTTYLSWVSILSVVLTLSLGNSIRTAVIDFADDIDGYMSSIFSLGTISSFLMAAVICIVSSFVFDKKTLYLILMCCIHSYSASIILAVQWRYMMDLKYVRRILLQSLPNIIIVLLSIFLINSLENDKYWGRVYAYTSVLFFTALFYLIFYFYKGHTLFNKEYWKYALVFSTPIIFHSLSTVILSQADRTMITVLRNSSETGIYGLAYQFGMIPLVVTTTFENIWVPWFTERMRKGDRRTINIMAIPYIFTVSILCSCIMLVAPEILKFMTTPDYYSATFLISPVVVATFFMFLASLSLDLEYYLKKTKTIAINTLIAAVINIVLNYFYIPIYGGVAAAYTTVVSYVISFAMHYFITRRITKELFPFKLYCLPICIVLVFAIMTSILMDYTFIRWIIGILLGIVFLLVGFILFRKKEFLSKYMN